MGEWLILPSQTYPPRPIFMDSLGSATTPISWARKTPAVSKESRASDAAPGAKRANFLMLFMVVALPWAMRVGAAPVHAFQRRSVTPHQTRRTLWGPHAA